MKNPNKLPPEIKGIREMVAKIIFTQRYPSWELEELDEDNWDENADAERDCIFDAKELLSKLTELGAVVLDNDQTLPRRPLPKEEYHNASPLFEEAALERMESRGWRKVVNLDGTPVKEG